MAPHSHCFTVATLPRPPNDDVQRQWKKHLNRRRFSVRDQGDRSAQGITPPSQLYPECGDPGSLEPDHLYPFSNTTATSPCLQNCTDHTCTQGISAGGLAEGSSCGATDRVSLSPAVGTLFKASWGSSDSSSEMSSRSVSPRRGGAHLGPEDVQQCDQRSRSAQPRAQSVVAVVTPRKVRFLIERIDPEGVAVPGDSGFDTGGTQSPDPPMNVLHTPLPRIAARSPTPSDNNLVPTPEALASTSSNTTFIVTPSFPSPLSTPPCDMHITSQSNMLFPPPTVWSASPSRTTSPSAIRGPSQPLTASFAVSVPDDLMQDVPLPHVSSLPSLSGFQLAAVDNTPRPPPNTLIPTFVVHRFRAGEQDGYTRSFKTSASFPLSQPPFGEWQLGDVFLHEHDQTGGVQIWIWDSEWVVSHEYDPHPTLPDRYLCFRSKLEPSWVKGQTVRSYKSRRRQREGQLLARGKARAC